MGWTVTLAKKRKEKEKENRKKRGMLVFESIKKEGKEAEKKKEKKNKNQILTVFFLLCLKQPDDFEWVSLSAEQRLFVSHEDGACDGGQHERDGCVDDGRHHEIATVRRPNQPQHVEGREGGQSK